MNSQYHAIKDFYSKLKFPGKYTIADLEYHHPLMRNMYLDAIDKHVDNNQQVLDIGAGTGYIANLFANKYQGSNFHAIDFSDSIKFGQDFAQQSNITNISFVQENFLNFDSHKQYDVIICQGVLHHIPDYPLAVEKIKKYLKPDGVLLLGLYHPFGKLLQKILPIDFGSKILQTDQMHNPYELWFTQKKVTKLFANMQLVNKYPTSAYCLNKSFIASGGLMLYVIRRQKI